VKRGRLNQWWEFRSQPSVDDQPYSPASWDVTVTAPDGTTVVYVPSTIPGRTYRSVEVQLTQAGEWTAVAHGVGTYVDGDGQSRHYDENSTEVILVR
jgi:hypothetical protein